MARLPLLLLCLITHSNASSPMWPLLKDDIYNAKRIRIFNKKRYQIACYQFSAHTRSENSIFGEDYLSDLNENLLVKFGGFNCTSPDGFFDMPRTEQEAKWAGLVKLSNYTYQQDSAINWAGKRYAKAGDLGVVLIYDVNGFIAGIQSGIQSSEWMPPSALKDHPFVTYEGVHYITFYFVDPRSLDSFRAPGTGTGTGLYIQNGTNYWDVVAVPLEESDLQYTLWYRGLCIPTMGQHYRYNVRRDSDCDALYPVFLMYNNGWLDGFGWTIIGKVKSTFFEDTPVLRSSNTPDCLVGPLTGMHVYLTTPCRRRCL